MNSNVLNSKKSFIAGLVLSALFALFAIVIIILLALVASEQIQIKTVTKKNLGLAVMGIIAFSFIVITFFLITRIIGKRSNLFVVFKILQNREENKPDKTWIKVLKITNLLNSKTSNRIIEEYKDMVVKKSFKI
ncbi:hypothetical protein [Mycoplasmopsis gallinacea]|uniref:Uncharacterized protein n=1 Tax=Mycoplasmopsis gallinacea TaxID=29556 RepID=A0A6H0V3E1_9BACT|nr:hypothetical protein [Mycoplasmopsis gallinacea]QIW62209.1 hypothetical protein GOQ20_02030 [Mycoplasmopsis gallinacea]